ncbi:MAG: 23S rRNA (uracil(1939)-C(5))-methyltransferase RlmD [Oscillospiraceae bacterium]|nr:23S rRNA (uracil(1939)-C(5))-methyltransferase RlmD [Oscillospiraceae bacterium]
MKEGECIRLTIDGYASDGAGVARIDGQVVFVRGALSGETCLVRLDKIGRSAVWGTAAEILTPSPARVTPDCPYYGQCGGCQLRHMTYAEELQFKRTRVEEVLRRIGGISLPVAQILGAAHPMRYRNKVQFPVGTDGAIGFYRTRSHHVIDTADCLLQPESAAQLRCAVQDWMRSFSVPAYDERTGKGLVRHLYLRHNRAGQSLCCLLVNGDKLPRVRELVDALRRAEPQLTGVVLGINTRRSNVILGDSYRTLWGEDFLMDTLCGFTFRLSIPSFYQVNPEQTEVLYKTALSLAGLQGNETVLDLYCGIGTISLMLARRARQVYGVEVVAQAVEDATENAHRNGITNASFFCADAGVAAARLAAEGITPDVIVVDPPRKGLGAEVPPILSEIAPGRIVYISCDSATLARDIARLAPLGYRPVKAVAVDMFPRTAHVETVVLLSKLHAKHHIEIDLELSELDLTSAESKATYEEIKAYVLEQHGLKVSNLYISQVKRKNGIIERENYNKPKSENAKVPQCPPEKEAAITEALKHFDMI